MTRPSVVVLAVVLVALAGCGGKPDSPTKSPGAPAVGVVEGRVLDDASAPVSGASIRILLTQLTVATDPEGGFRIEKVPAGPIRVVASADGYTTQTKSLFLPAGGKATVSFVLAGAPAVVPRHETKTFSDTIFCGLVAGAACPQDPTQDAEETAKVHPFEVGFDLRGMVLELEWQPPAAGVNNNLAFDVHAASAQGCGPRYTGAFGTSVLRLEVLEGFPVSGGHQCVIVRGAGNQATIQQTYTLYVTLFYHEAPPEGFSVLSG